MCFRPAVIAATCITMVQHINTTPIQRLFCRLDAEVTLLNAVNGPVDRHHYLHSNV